MPRETPIASNFVLERLPSYRAFSHSFACHPVR